MKNTMCDQTTTVCVKNPKYHPLFINMCPVYCTVNRSNGKFNGAMGFAREYAALFSAIYDNDYALSRYLNDPEQDSYEALHRIGVSVSPEDEKEIQMLHHISSQVLANA